MGRQREGFYHFDRFGVDTARRVLLRDGEPVPLTSKAFEVLLALLQSGGEVLGKDELMRKVWPDSVVEEANLNVQISALRKALGVSPQDRRLIVTIPGRGFRFVADVTPPTDEAAEFVIRERTRTHIVVEESVTGDGDDRDAEGRVSDAAGGLPAASETARPSQATTPSRNALGARADAARPPAVRRAVLATATTAVALAALALTVYFFVSQGEVPFEEVRLTKLTTTGRATAAAVSPDGKLAAFVTSNRGLYELSVRQVATGGGVPVAAAADAAIGGLTFSNDGSRLYYLLTKAGSSSLLYTVASLGGTASKLTEDLDSPVTFSPDGGRMAFLRGYPDLKQTALVVANSDGTGERKLASFKMSTSILNEAPAWSPDGAVIACPLKESDEGGEFHSVLSVRVSDGAARPVTKRRWQHVGRVAWLPGAKGFVMTAADEETAPAQQLWLVSYPSGEARKITNDLSDYRDLSVSADGRLLAAVQYERRANVWVAPEGDAARASQLTSGNYDGLDGLAWTPGGEIVFATREGGSSDLYAVVAGGAGRRGLTAGGRNDQQPAVSSDGRLVVFSSDRAGGRHLWLAEADGGNPRRLTSGVRDVDPAFSPDGRWVVYKSYTSGVPNVLRVPVAGGEPTRLTEKISGRPAVSPDGRLVACFYRDPALSPNRFALIPFEGGEPSVLSNYPGGPIRWTTDGRALTYVKTEGGVSNVWRLPINGGAPARLTDFKSEIIFSFDWSLDGRQLALARGSAVSDVILIRDLK